MADLIRKVIDMNNEVKKIAVIGGSQNLRDKLLIAAHDLNVPCVIADEASMGIKNDVVFVLENNHLSETRLLSTQLNDGEFDKVGFERQPLGMSKRAARRKAERDAKKKRKRKP